MAIVLALYEWRNQGHLPPSFTEHFFFTIAETDFGFGVARLATLRKMKADYSKYLKRATTNGTRSRA
jgi:hypothetical protein